MGAPQAGALPMTDIELIEKSIIATQAVILEYIEPGPRNAEQSMQRLIAMRTWSQHWSARGKATGRAR
jgi:hypothetical protein